MPKINLSEEFFRFKDFLNEKDLEESQEAFASLINKTCTGSEMTGWVDYPKKYGFELVESIKKINIPVFYDCIVVIGIGGSYLGTRAVAECLSPSFPNSKNDLFKPIYYAGHQVSESYLIELLDFLDTKKPLINVVSKSGATLEPAIAFRVLKTYLEKRFGAVESRQRIIITTDPKNGSLRKLCNDRKEKKEFLSFEIPENVGGRFSVLTAVGLVPLYLAGHDVLGLLQGADSVFSEVQKEKSFTRETIVRYAAFRKKLFDQNYRMEVLATREPKLLYLVEWWKQLFGETEGKNQVGIFPAGLTLTTDLHSLGQYMQEGARQFFETFLEFKEPIVAKTHHVEKRLKIPADLESQDGLSYLDGIFIDKVNEMAGLATSRAHAQGLAPVLKIEVDRLDSQNLGGLLAFYQLSSAVSALLFDVNPFNQPGVEAYKNNMFQLLGKEPEKNEKG